MPRIESPEAHYSRPLTNVAVAYWQDDAAFISQRVFPRVPVQFRGDVYYVFPRDAWNRTDAGKRAPGSESQGTSYDFDMDSYLCEVYALHHDISDIRRANTDDVFDLDANGTRLITRQLLTKYEHEWTNANFAPGVWDRQLQGVAATPGTDQFLQWDNDNSDPVELVDNEKMRMLQLTGGFEPNVLVVGYPVMLALKHHPVIRERIRYAGGDANPAAVTPAALASLFGVDEVMTARAISNTAAEGEAESNQFIQGKHALLAYRSGAPSMEEPSAGYTFVWTGLTGAIDGWQSKRFRMEQNESDRIEVQSAWDHKIVAQDLGAFFADAVA